MTYDVKELKLDMEKDIRSMRLELLKTTDQFTQLTASENTPTRLVYASAAKISRLALAIAGLHDRILQYQKVN